MKPLSSLSVTIALLALLWAQNPAPTPNADEVKRELNAAAEAYRDGKWAEAEARAEKAVQLDPQNKTALQFAARTIHAQYRPGDLAAENIAKARQAIVAYQRVIAHSPGDDEAYKAVAYLFKALKEDGLFGAWILQRALDGSIANEKRAEAFVVLASRDWECSFNITEQPATKVTIVRGSKAYIQYKLPKERVEFERAKECADRALEMVNAAITLTPDSESAWSYKTNILSELEKLAEMSGRARHKRELHRQYEEALRQTTELSKRSVSKP